jgi:bile acid:Na+ symporter, BASS family
VGLIGDVLFALLWAMSFTMTVLFIAARMFHLGLRAKPADITALTRDPSFVARAVVANVLVVPAVGMAMAVALPLSAEVAIAIVLVAALGGGIDVFELRETTTTAEGVHIVALVFALSTLAIVISPAIRVLLQPLGTLVVGPPWRFIAVAVLGALVPLLGGVLIRRVAPTTADLLSAVMLPIAVALFVAAALTTFLVRAPSPRSIGVSGIVGMVGLTVAARGIGWLLGGPSRQRRAVLARVTAMRNVGLSLLLALVSFPDTGVAAAIVLFAVLETALRLLTTGVGSIMMPAVPVPSPRERKP